MKISAILKSIRQFFEDRTLTESQAKAIEAASLRQPVKVKTRDLPSRTPDR